MLPLETIEQFGVPLAVLFAFAWLVKRSLPRTSASAMVTDGAAGSISTANRRVRVTEYDPWNLLLLLQQVDYHGFAGRFPMVNRTLRLVPEATKACRSDPLAPILSKLYRLKVSGTPTSFASLPLSLISRTGC